MSLLLDAFSNELTSIYDSILAKFPNDKDLLYGQTKIQASLHLSPRLVSSTFLDNVIPYLDKLEARDDAFFLSLSKNELCLDLSDKWESFSAIERTRLFRGVEKLVKIAGAIRVRQ